MIMYYYGKKALTAGVLSLLVLGSTATAWGAEAEPETDAETEEIVITANRIPNKKVDTPANVSIVTSQQIEDWNSRSVPDALENVPGVRIVRNGLGANATSIFINGDERVLVLVDGRRVNINLGDTATRASIDANTLPPVDMIDHIEVVKGGASTVYGADAVGGVVNIITKKPEQISGKVHAGYGSWGNQQWGFDVGGKQNKTGFIVAGNREKISYLKYKDTNGDTKKWPGQSNSTQDSISLKLTQDFTDKDGLTLTYDYSNLDGYSPYSVVNYYSSSHVTKKTNNVSLMYDWNRDQDNSGFIRAYRNYYSYFNYGKMDETDWAIEGQQNFALSDTNKLLAGLEYRHVEADNETAYDEKKGYHNRSVFLQDQWQFAPTWQLNTGIRYDNYSQGGSRTTGSAAINKKFNEDSHAYISWNQIFKVPTIDDLYYNVSYGLWGGYYGTEGLKPENGNIYTIGYSFKSSPSTEWNVSAFYSDIRDAIRWYSDDYMNYYARNINREKKRGFELSVDHKLNDHWDLNASYTYTKVKNNLGDTGYTRDYNYAPNYYQFGVRYHSDEWTVSLTGRAATGLAKIAGLNSYGYPAEHFGENRYITMDLTARRKFDEHWTGFASIYNLNNAAYAEMGGASNGQDYYPMPGRRFIVGAEYKF
jgi:vitamin B12 transporter